MDPERDLRLDTRLANFNERIPKVLESVDKTIGEYNQSDDYEKLLIEEIKKSRNELEEIYVRFNQARPTSDPIKIVPFYDNKASLAEMSINQKEEQLKRHRDKKWNSTKSNMMTAFYIMLAIWVVYMIARFGHSEPMQKVAPDQPVWANQENIMYLQQKMERMSAFPDPGRYHAGVRTYL
jgi:hypothetical protein